MPAFMNVIRGYFLRPDHTVTADQTGSETSQRALTKAQLIGLLADLESRSDRLARMARREVLEAGFAGKRFSDIADQAQDVAALSAQARESLGIRP